MANNTCSRYYLVVNADDFGYCDQRNQGIVESFRDGIVSSASLLVNSTKAFEAVQLAKQYRLPLGLHLNLTEGVPVNRQYKTLTLNNGSMRGKLGFRKALQNNEIDLSEIQAETRAQLQWFIDNVGLLPTHIDGHQHVHVLPDVCRTLATLMKSYGVKWTRLPVELNMNKCLWIEEVQKRFYKSVIEDAQNSKSVFTNCEIRFPGHFIGLSTMGRDMTVQRLQEALDRVYVPRHQTELNIEAGETLTQRGSIICELMVHPGYRSILGYGGCGEGPDEFACSADREHELKTLKSPVVKEYFKTRNIKLGSYKDV